MKDAFDEVTRIRDRCVAGARKKMEAEVLDLARAQGIGIRQDDGESRQITLSKPTSVESAYMTGMRYIENDGTQTENLFPVESGRPIVGGYKGSLAKRWPEYEGTHKQTVTFPLVAGKLPPTTSVNTIGMGKGNR